MKKLTILDTIILMFLAFLLGSGVIYYLSAGKLDQAINKSNTERVADSTSAQLHIDWKNGILLKDAKVFEKDRDVVIGFVSDGRLAWSYIPSDEDKVKEIADDLKNSAQE